jgi:hypothetical protein
MGMGANMKASVLVSIARQVEGEYVFVRVIKANKNSEKLFRFLRENELPRTTKLGDVECVLEYGVIEDIDIEEE